MKHSVLCRAAEIDEWAGLGRSDVLDKLGDERKRFVSKLGASNVSELVRDQAFSNAEHIPKWLDALEQL